MTRIIIRKTKNNEYLGFTCHGHAGFADKGEDIVCAALSVLTINTVNSLEQLTQTAMEVVTEEEEGIIICRFTGTLSEAGRLLMDAYVLGVENVFQEYGNQYVEIEFKEV